MPPKSKIAQLDPRIKEVVDEAVRDGRMSIDEIVALIKSHGAEVGRSAVGVYVKNANEQMEKYRQAQNIAKVWIAKFGNEPDGDVGRLLREMLRMVSFQTLSTIGESEAGAGPMDVMLLAKAMDHLAAAEKRDVDRARSVNALVKERMEKAAAEVETAAKKSGVVSPELIQEFRNKILGIEQPKAAPA